MPYHFFVALTWDRAPERERWKCRNCGMKTRDRRVAERMQGEPCYPVRDPQ